MSERRRESEGERDFERRTKLAFDGSVRELDPATRSRLAAARRNALQAGEERGARRGWAWSLAPAGALAASVLAVAILVLHGGPRTEVGLQPGAPITDLEILLGEEGLEFEMLDDEIEFYAWLEDQPELATPAAIDDGVG
jgi:hypothetical protein